MIGKPLLVLGVLVSAVGAGTGGYYGYKHFFSQEGNDNLGRGQAAGENTSPQPAVPSKPSDSAGTSGPGVGTVSSGTQTTPIVGTPSGTDQDTGTQSQSPGINAGVPGTARVGSELQSSAGSVPGQGSQGPSPQVTRSDTEGSPKNTQASNSEGSTGTTSTNTSGAKGEAVVTA